MKIGTIGFPEDQLKKLEKILTLSKSKTLSLTAFEPAELPDVLLVFGDTLDDHSEVAEFPESYQERLILVNKKKPDSDQQAHIKLPFISSRVLRTLEAYEPLPQSEPVVAEVIAAEAVESTAVGTSAQTVERQETDVSAVPVETGAAEAAIDTSVDTLAEEEPELALETITTEAEAEKDNPFSKYDAQIEAVRRQQAELAEQHSDDSYSVLVVDDSHPMQQMLAKELQHMDQPVEIDFADDGETALDKAEKNHYDFIFLDIMMPGIDGFETCTRLRQMPGLKKTPIIMLSSKTSPLDEVKGIMAGSSTYLTKPIDHVEFQKVIKRVSRWVSEFKK
ncbi:response regulator [Marinobacterium sediminicola]|uniref:Response regulator receiver domain-containing protein n=1 Tax=Marinobacterium sediminicola TaxID=518898 RepID=A0ABY1RY58_9GAMM|nr:response regulator [Marinobacterium sediminicola]ULG68721.1 response regulator [Marinobacterium sediminicola]SMR73247.1 Response regulator receiver domain-containing protein [Marinobacterium sediminicola]